MRHFLRDRVDVGAMLAGQGGHRLADVFTTTRAFAKMLDVPVSFFFEDAPSDVSGGQPGMAEASSPNYVVDFLSSSEGLQLNRSFVKISDAKVRRKIVDLVKALAADEEAD